MGTQSAGPICAGGAGGSPNRGRKIGEGVGATRSDWLPNQTKPQMARITPSPHQTLSNPLTSNVSLVPGSGVERYPMALRTGWVATATGSPVSSSASLMRSS